MYKVLIIDDEAPARIAISRLGHWADYSWKRLHVNLGIPVLL